MYKSKFEAYPFLRDSSDDVCCDFEILTDEIASTIGHLRALVDDAKIKDDLLFMCEMIYHANASLRMTIGIAPEELSELEAMTKKLSIEAGEVQKQFLIPIGSVAGSVAHILRSKCKAAVRLAYKHIQADNYVSNRLIDFLSLSSNYFFVLALKLNKLDGIEEIPFYSRSYEVQ